MITALDSTNMSNTTNPQAIPQKQLDLSKLMAQVKASEAQAQEENQKLKQLLSIQETLMQKQREALLNVAELSSQLMEVDKQRKALQEELLTQRTQLLLDSAESKRLSATIEEVLSDANIPVSDPETSQVILQSIEDIQKGVFTVTESSLQQEDLKVKPEEVKTLVKNINTIIESAIQSGTIKEDPEDTVRRQGYVIDTLISEPN